MTRLPASGLWLALAVLLATGCARQPVAPDIEDWSAHQALLQNLEHWHITGRLGLRVPEQNASASVRWRQDRDDFHIDLSGPFGQGRTLIHGDQQHAVLEQAGERPLTASSAETLLWDTTGWVFPVAQLTYWVKGIPAPFGPPAEVEHNSQGWPERLTQAGWTLDYSRFQAVDGYPLPGRIVAQSGDIRLTLIIRQWQLPDAGD
ncbi:lipoprotein insertase outer membrane protein LolB [Marinimicrobium alkaliphilum]|uniref:lipoprotein insertase outer membrane protein LolB n=1 Tax=Marinimicrobium alkaliphilum TaxID=2202654 RepID=UPI000DB8FA93|nr:lipoprotein insertase outer membrane protein LolB [Marinimicrobium alkaliphilum]